MTLILSCIHRDFIVQVSDRRTVVGRSPATRSVVSEDFNKLVFYENRFAFSFCGVAELRGISTARWFALNLDPKLEFEDAIHRVADLASETLRSMALRTEDSWLCFSGVGWIDQDEALSPCQVTISNFRSEEGSWLSRPASRLCVVTEGFGPRFQRQGRCLCTSPSRLSEESLVALGRGARRLFEAEASPLMIADLLRNEVLRVSERDGTVGRGVVAGILPRLAARQNTFGLWSPPPLIARDESRSKPTFFTWASDDGPGAHRRETQLPLYVSRLLTVLDGSVSANRGS